MLAPDFTHNHHNGKHATSRTRAITGITYQYKDWELICDNTGTCRAAGYIEDIESNNEAPNFLDFSIMLIRKAGAGEPVTGLIKQNEFAQNPPPESIELWIGKHNLGNITIKEEGSPLSQKQVQALIQYATTQTPIVVQAEGAKTTIFNRGIAAILLKIDDFHKRINTPDALIRKGNEQLTNVLEPQPLPRLTIPVTLENDEALQEHYHEQEEKIRTLTQSDYQSACMTEYEQDDGSMAWQSLVLSGEDEMSIYPLSANTVLVSRNCWSAAYNYGDAYWLIDNNITTANLITPDGTSYEKGQINEYIKCRGLGDCWNSQTYSWNGKEFILTEQKQSNMFRLFNPSFFWEMPTLLYNITNNNASDHTDPN